MGSARIPFFYCCDAVGLQSAVSRQQSADFRSSRFAGRGPQVASSRHPAASSQPRSAASSWQSVVGSWLLKSVHT